MKRIVDIKKYRNDIISLWYECFGDEAEYIEFFLDRCPNKLCLGCFENNRLVSMLFLLNGEVDGFPAKYIYAACTAHFGSVEARQDVYVVIGYFSCSGGGEPLRLLFEIRLYIQNAQSRNCFKGRFGRL